MLLQYVLAERMNPLSKTTSIVIFGLKSVFKAIWYYKTIFEVMFGDSIFKLDVTAALINPISFYLRNND